VKHQRTNEGQSQTSKNRMNTVSYKVSSGIAKSLFPKGCSEHAHYQRLVKGINGGKQVYDRFKNTLVSYEILRLYTPKQRKMRFRAQMTDIGHIHSFTKILTTVSKVCKVCVLQLGPSNIGFNFTEKAVTGGTKLWCELQQQDFFDEYRIEGKDERNEIYLEIVADNLVRAMRSAQNSQSLKLKLTRKQTSCLTFEVSLPSLASHTRSVVHDVPVGIIPSRFWEDYSKPNLPNCDICIGMPSTKTLKSVVERMKNISGYAVVAANRVGQLTIEIETDEVTITTYFKNMEVDFVEELSADERPEVIRRDERFEAKIDIQKLYSFLNAQQSIPTKVACNISDSHSLHLAYHTDETVVNYYLPAMIS